MSLEAEKAYVFQNRHIYKIMQKTLDMDFHLLNIKCEVIFVAPCTLHNETFLPLSRYRRNRKHRKIFQNLFRVLFSTYGSNNYMGELPAQQQISRARFI
jgi:hypothetical protein